MNKDKRLRIIDLRRGDVLNEGLNVHGQSGDKLEVVLSGDGATLNCTVVSDKGDPVRQAQVILVPDEPNNHAFNLFRQSGIGESGTCKIRGVAPGAYRAFAFPPEPYVDIRRVDAWKPYEKFGKPVRFAPKETVQLEIPAIPAQSEEQ